MENVKAESIIKWTCLCPAFNCYQHFANLTAFTISQFFEVFLTVIPRHYVILLTNTCKCFNTQWLFFLTNPNTIVSVTNMTIILQYYLIYIPCSNFPKYLVDCFVSMRIQNGPFTIFVFSAFFLTYNSYINYFSLLTIFIVTPFSMSFISWRNHRN